MTKYALLTIVVTVLLLGPTKAYSEDFPPEIAHLFKKKQYPIFKKGVIGVEYHRFTILKVKDNIVALYILPDPRFGWDGVTYRWFCLNDGTDRFFRPLTKNGDDLPNPAVTTGAGQTKGAEDAGMGTVKAGPIKMRWSGGSHRMGWLYFRDLKPTSSIMVYPKQFSRLEDFAGKLHDDSWRIVAKKPVASSGDDGKEKAENTNGNGERKTGRTKGADFFKSTYYYFRSIYYFIRSTFDFFGLVFDCAAEN